MTKAKTTQTLDAIEAGQVVFVSGRKRGLTVRLAHTRGSYARKFPALAAGSRVVSVLVLEGPRGACYQIHQRTDGALFFDNPFGREFRTVTIERVEG